VPRPDESVKTFTGLATKWGFKAREREDPDDAGKRVRGLFSRALLEVLRAGRIDGEELKNYTLNRSREVAGDGYRRPDIKVEPGLFFGEAADRPYGTLVISASPQRRGHSFRLLGPDTKLVVRAKLEAAPWRSRPLDYGQYWIFDEDDVEKAEHVEIIRRVVDVTF
jgi:hypothetical protein